MSGCGRELNAHFYSAASLRYHVPDTWHDTTPSHIILTLGQPVLIIALFRKSECQASCHFGMSWPVIKPVPSRSLEQTLYLLSYRGQFWRLYGPGHVKMCLMPYANNKGADQPPRPRSLISSFVVCCLASMICILAISKVSRF